MKSKNTLGKQDPATERALRILEQNSGEYDGVEVLHSIAPTVDEDDESFMKCSPPLAIIITCLLVAVIIPVLFATDVLGNEDLEGIPVLENIDIDGFFDSDPYGGSVTPETPEAAYRWASREGTGLELSLLNALDDSWQSFFEKAVSDWENGDPDSLTLSSRRVPYDFQCKAETGLFKVCNGDYGDTQWRGLNVVLLDFQEKWIYSSTAKMNEFYLKSSSNAQKQYTMCHELGHGFGLPHWDEDFFNRNLGNCMDYTDNPRSNAQPDRSNFEFLANLYGVIGGTPPPRGAPPTGGAVAPQTLIGVGGGDGRSRALSGKEGGAAGAENNNVNNKEDKRMTLEEEEEFLGVEAPRTGGKSLRGGSAFHEDTASGYYQHTTTATDPAPAPGGGDVVAVNVPGDDIIELFTNAAKELEIPSSHFGSRHHRRASTTTTPQEDSSDDTSAWKMINSREHGGIYERKLGDRYVARAFMLHAN